MSYAQVEGLRIRTLVAVQAVAVQAQQEPLQGLKVPRQLEAQAPVGQRLRDRDPAHNPGFR